MSISEYKKWMTEAFIDEAEKFKARSKESGKIVYYKTKDAMDAAIKDKKAEPIEKGDDKDDKKKPVSIDIDASGGFGDDDKDAGAVSGNNKEVERDKDGVPEDEMDFVDELDDVVDNYKEMKANYEETKKYGDPDDPEEKEQMDLDRVEYRKAEDKLRKYRAKAKRQGWDDEEDVHDKLYGDDEPKGDDDVEPVKYKVGKGIPTSSDVKVDQETKDTILQDLNPPRDAERDENGLPTNEEDWDKEMDEVESMYEKARDAYEAAERDATDAAFRDDEEEAEYLSDRAQKALEEYEKYKKVRDAYEAKGQELGVYARSESIKVINGKKYKAIKESVNKRVTVKEVKSWLKGLEEFRYRKIPGVDVRRIASFVNNGLSETDLPKSLQKKWENAKYSKEKGLADRFMKERINKKLTQNESKHPLKEQYDRLFKNKVVL